MRKHNNNTYIPQQSKKPTAQQGKLNDFSRQIFNHYKTYAFYPWMNFLFRNLDATKKKSYDEYVKCVNNMIMFQGGFQDPNQPGRHKVSPFVWLMVILRVKTILYEKLEANGFKCSQKSIYGYELKLDKKQDYAGANDLGIGATKKSVSSNYTEALMDQYQNELTRNQRLRFYEVIRQEIIKGIDEQEKFAHIKFFWNEAPGCLLIEKIIEFKVPEPFEGTVWHDFRVTSSYLKAIDKYFVSKQGNLPQNFDFFDDFTQLQIGQLMDPDSNSHKLTDPPEKVTTSERTCFHVVFIGQLGVFSVQPRRIILYNPDLQVVGFAYTQFLELSEFGKDDARLMARQSRGSALLTKNYLTRYLQTRKPNSNYYECFRPERVLLHVPPEKRRFTAYEVENCIKKQQIKLKFNIERSAYCPLQFQDQTTPKKISEGFKRWQAPFAEWVNKLEFHESNDQFRKASAQIVDQVSDEKGSFQLLKLIKSVPKIKFSLTPEQELMISTPQNLLCLGRSGTGKTTSSALRLFATEAFYKYHTLLNDFKVRFPDRSIKEFQVPEDFMHGRSELRLTFLSASPVLVNEVKRFYIDFKTHFTQELTNARNRRLQRKQKALEEAKKQNQVEDDSLMDQIEIIDSDEELDTQLEERKESTVDQNEEPDEDAEIKKFLEMEIAELEQEEQIEKQLSLVKSMDFLTSDDFPLFLTVKKMLYMLDATTDYPFFCRDSSGEQIGMEGTAGWHNEGQSGGQGGGVFMINNYHKSDTNYDEQIKQFGLRLLEIDQKIQNSQIPETSQSDEQPRTDQYAMSDFNLGSLATSVCQSNAHTFTVKNKQLSYEVDFESFKSKFWPKVAPWTRITALVAWTEIYSKIKGHQDAWQNDVGGLSLPEYMVSAQSDTKKKASKKKQMDSFLHQAEMLEVYKVFLQYEKWKNEQGAYDLMDLVNHILRQIKQRMFKPSMLMHFMMVDEVQDLCQNTISLLMQMAEKNVFFSGDTAQTIAKGVGFRFYDLKQVFQAAALEHAGEDISNYPNLQPPKVLYLAKNFRSHARILDLANSVVGLVELLFPKTIDKLMKETSDLHGPKPLIIEDLSQPNMEKLFKKYLLWSGGADTGKMQQQDSNSGDKKAGQTFGCSKVVIVRDQGSKQNVPDFLKDLLCLTVYEAKGLEFDDVILFNFFKDSKCDSQWKLLNDVQSHTHLVKIHADKFFDLDTLVNKRENEENNEDIEVLSDDSESFEKVDENPKDEMQIDTMTQKPSPTDHQLGNVNTKVTEEGKEYQTILSLKRDRGEIYRKYAQVCTELKLLYVAITRPKTNLIIYDEDKTIRKPIQAYWQAINAVDVLNKAMSADPDLCGGDREEDRNLIPDHIKKLFSLGPKYGVSESMLQLTQSPEDIEKMKMNWRLQGLKLFKVKYYQAAIQCFEHSGDKNLVIRCRAYDAADTGASLRGEHDAQMALAKDKKNGLSKLERNQIKKEAKDKQKEYKKLMNQAGHLFCEIDLDRQGAMCFFSSGNVKGSAEIFEKQNKFGQAAQCYFRMGRMDEAARLFAKGKLFANAFECYERMENWDGLMSCLHRNKNEFSASDKQVLIDKYFPIALNSVYQLYEMLDPGNAQAKQLIGGEENAGKIKQMQIKLKYQRSSSIIKEEEDEEESFEDSEESQEEEAKPEVSQQEDEQKKKINLDVTTQSMPLAEEQKEERKQNDDSFEAMLSGSDQENGNNNQDDLAQPIDDKNDQVGFEINQGGFGDRGIELDLLSNIDPDDEFLKQGQSLQLVEQISLNESSYEVLSSQTSEFSLVQGSKMHSFIQSCASFADVIQKSDDQKSTHTKQSENNTIDLASIVSKQQAQSSNIDNDESGSAISGLLDKSKYSVIQYQRDTFAEDMVVQKLIYYISLFSEEIHEELAQIRSKDALSQIVANKEPQLDEEDDELAYMLIDLDELTPSLLTNVLNTLEYYGLYSMCIMLCDRYKMLNMGRGRYVSAIAQRYSNLNQFQYTWSDKFKQQNSTEAQKKYTLVANEAMHNVLNSVGAGITEESSDTDAWRDQCFTVLFKLGFWKKLVFLMQPESGMQLAWACEDYASLKLLYAVCKCGETDPTQVNKILSRNINFQKLCDEKNNKDSNDVSAQLVQSILAQEEALYSFDMNKLNNGLQVDADQNKKLFYNETSSLQSITLAATLIANCPSQKSSQKHNNLRIPQILKNLESHKQVKMFDGLLDILQSEDVVKMRQVYMSFKCSSLDGLNLFEAYQGNYMLVSKNSPLMSDITKIFQSLQLACFNMENLVDKLQQMSEEMIDKNQITNLLIAAGQAALKAPEIDKIPLGSELAQVVDLELNRFLVPKRWVINLINYRIADFLLVLIYQSPKNMHHWVNVLFKLQTLLQRQGDMSCVKELQAKLRQLEVRRTAGFGLTLNEINNLYQYRYQTPSPFVKGSLFNNLNSTDYFILPSIKKAHKLCMLKLQDKQMGIQMAPSLPLAVKPEFSIFKPVQKNKSLFNQHLQQAFQVFAQATENPMKDTFPGLVFKSVQEFFVLDCYPILQEVLSQKIKQQADLPKLKQRLSIVYDLLDAHVYLKCNDWNEAANSMSKFLMNSYTTIDMKLLSDIILESLTRSLFAYSIYANNSQEGILIDSTQIWNLNFSREETVMLQQKKSSEERKVVLQDVRVKVGSFKPIQKYLNWVLCLVQTAEANLNSIDKEKNLTQYFEVGLRAIESILLSNLSEQEIIKLRNTMVEISQIIFQSKNNKDENYKTFSNSGNYDDYYSSDSEQEERKAPKSKIQVKKSGQSMQLNPVKFKHLKALSNSEDIIKVRQDVQQNPAFSYVLYKLANPKQVASRVNQINLDVESALQVGLVVEKETLDKRRTAAEKITQFWLTKRESILHQNNSAKPLPSIFTNTVPPGQKRLQIELQNPFVSQNLAQANWLQRKLLAILGSGAPLCNGSLDLQHILTAISRVTQAQEKLVQALQSQATNKADSLILSTQINQACMGLKHVNEAELVSLENWLSQQQNENKTRKLQMSKAELTLKREKWDSVIQFHRKKRVMLRHLNRKQNK